MDVGQDRTMNVRGPYPKGLECGGICEEEECSLIKHYHLALFKSNIIIPCSYIIMNKI